MPFLFFLLSPTSLTLKSLALLPLKKITGMAEKKQKTGGGQTKAAYCGFFYFL